MLCPRGAKSPWLCLLVTNVSEDTRNGPYARAVMLLPQPLQTMGDIQPGVSGVSVFKPVEGVKGRHCKGKLSITCATMLYVQLHKGYQCVHWAKGLSVKAAHARSMVQLLTLQHISNSLIHGTISILCHCLPTSQETEEVYEVDGTFVHRSRMTPLPGAGIAKEASIPGVPLKAAAKVQHQLVIAEYQTWLAFGPAVLPTWRWCEQLRNMCDK